MTAALCRPEARQWGGGGGKGQGEGEGGWIRGWAVLTGVLKCPNAFLPISGLHNKASRSSGPPQNTWPHHIFLVLYYSETTSFLELESLLQTQLVYISTQFGISSLTTVVTHPNLSQGGHEMPQTTPLIASNPTTRPPSLWGTPTCKKPGSQARVTGKENSEINENLRAD